jgi:hypothetical protein
MNCDCIYHRYHVVHTVQGKDTVYSHSQATWDADLRTVPTEQIHTFPSVLYQHRMTAAELERAAAQAG